MHPADILFVSAIIIVPVVLVLAMVLPARIRMERRARELRQLHPQAEQASCYLAFRSTFSWSKQREMNELIAEMARDGWTFLRATAANPLRTMRFWGGGLNLHFIRTPVAGSSGSFPVSEPFHAHTHTTNH